MANTLNMRLVLDGDQFRAELRSSTGEVQKFSTSAEKSGVSAQNAFAGTQRSATSLLSTVKSVGVALTAFAGPLVVVFGARQVSQLADSYANLTSKIRNVTTSESELARVRQSVFEIAQRTRQEYSATGELYTRLTRATAELGLSEQKRLTITDTINKALVVSGATAQESTNAIIQLSQGLAAGALRGEEFNSVAEQAPIILDLLSNSLGKNRGELRAMAEDGLLTAEVLTGALLQGAASIDAQFANMSLTIGGASTQLKNAALEYVGQTDTALGASQSLASGISLVATNLGALAEVAISVGGVLVAVYAGKSVAAISAYAAEQLKGVAAASALRDMERLAAADAVRTAEARLLEARQTQALATSQYELVRASVATAEAMHTTAAANVIASQRHVDAARTAGAQSFALRQLALAEGDLAKAQKVRAASYGALAGLDASAARLQRELGAAQVAGAAQVDVLAAANVRLAASKTGVQVAMAAVGRAGSALFAAMGGWVTVALAAAYAAYTMGDAMLHGGASAREAAGELDRMSESMEKAAEKQKLIAQGLPEALADQGLAMQAVTAEIAKLKAQQEGSIAVMDTWQSKLIAVSGPLGFLHAKVYEYVSNASGIDTLNESMDRHALAMVAVASRAPNMSQALQEAAETLVAMGVPLESVIAQVDTLALSISRFSQLPIGAGGTAAFSDNVQKSIADLTKLQETLGLTRAEMILYEATKTIVAEAAGKDAAAHEQLTAALSANTVSIDEVAEAAGAGAVALLDTARSAAAATSATEANTKAEAASAAAKAKSASANKTRAAESKAFLAAAAAEEAAYGAQAKKAAAETQARFASQAAQMRNEITLLGLSGDAREQERIRLEASGLAFNEHGDYVTDWAKIYRESLTEISELSVIDSILEQFEDSPFDGLIDKIGDVEAALRKAQAATGEAFNPELIVRLQSALEKMQTQLQIKTVGSYKALLGAAQTFTKEGSKGFKAMEVGMAALSIVQDILALKAAVTAVLAQGAGGDPISAFPRMAAMAAAVAPFLASIGVTLSSLAGGGGGGGSSSAEARQATQGRGTVLGDADAQSESIMNALEITANATSELVGINRGMLTALQSLQNGISGASASVARVEFGDVSLGGGAGESLDFLTGGQTLSGRLLSSIFGGSQDLIDQGVVIVGGTLRSIIDNVVASSYQTIETDGGWFSRDRTSDDLTPLGENATGQIRLILQSIGDAVSAGAEALGISREEIDAAIAAFRIAEIRISTMDLTGEEAQAELAAVFSTIFDGLAGSVVPFITQFQRVGEGLGETLVRVATGVQVTQEAVARLGFMLDEVDPERFAQISEGLIEAVGGIESFISGMQSFVENFASEEVKFGLLQSDLTRAFEQAGLVVPATRDAMWDLMASLDGTTEEGQRQIATLLGLSGTAHAYYSQLERDADVAARAQQREADAAAEAAEALAQAKRKYLDLVNQLRDEIDSTGMSDFALEIREISRWAADTTAAMNTAAVAAGLQAANETDLGLVHQVAAQRAAAAIARLRSVAQGLVTDLYGSAVDQIDSQIASIESAQQSSFDTQLSGIEAVDNAAADSYQRQLAALQSIREYLDSQLLGDLSTLTPEQRLAEAQRQFDSAVAAAAGGDLDALASLPGLADSLLREGVDYLAQGTEAFGALESTVRGILQGFAGTVLGPAPADGSGGGFSGGGTVTVSTELQALYDQRDALLLQLEQENREALAQQLASVVRELLVASGESLATVAASLGLDLASLVADLGINLTDLTSETATALAGVAQTLGVDLSELAAQVGVDLGGLGDRQSLLNQALDATLAGVPEDIRAQLLGPLDALRSAVTETDVNDAMFSLLHVTDSLAPNIRDLLAPFFSEIDPTPIISELSTLRDLNNLGALQLAEVQAQSSYLVSIRDALNAGNVAVGLPSYQVGTGYVPTTGPALLHESEMVLPAPVADFFRREGIPQARSSGGGDSQALVAELRAMRAEHAEQARRMEAAMQRLERAEADGANKISDGLRQQRSFALMR